ncbi:MAG: hypothetical protein IJQ90_04765 [Alphaproteobacteria bacterium]|nr:hypothetical protein [Alphaproteobacteria bacterium]
MKKTFENLYMRSIIAFAMVIVGANFADAAVTSRPTAANAAAAVRAQNRTTARVPTTNVSSSVATTPEIEPEPEPVIEPDPEPEVPIIVDNKTSMFEDVMSDLGALESDMSNDERAAAIRRQRALLDTPSQESTAGVNMGRAGACDTNLRKCMMEKCGNDFTNCANDSTTIWGQKIELCRAKTECTAHDYALIAPEILADRDMNVRMQHYNSVINCGNRYNNCIFTQCGTTLNKCLAKKDGDNAISKCASIANECKSMDNGLASRVMGVFGDLRKIATAQVQKDEARLYELRDLMRNQCNRFGAMFDERTLDCVYTVNFFAGEDRTLMASKKLYSGDTFQCNANWFGIDITTYIENAQRLTRSQKSASAAAFGAGAGTAAGLASSDAIGRALKTQRAEKAVDAAQNEKQCSTAGGTWSGKKCTDANGNEMKFDKDGKVVDNNQTSQQGGVQPTPAQTNPEQTTPTETPEQTNDGSEQQDVIVPIANTSSQGLLANDDPYLQKINQASHGGLSYSGAGNKTGNNKDNLPPVNEKYTKRYYCPIYPKKCPKGTPIYVNYGGWRVYFGTEGTTDLHGVSVCSLMSDTEDHLRQLWTASRASDYKPTLGTQCFCKLVLSSGKTSEWVLATDPAKTDFKFDTAAKCAEDCPRICTVIINEKDYRKKMYDTLH